MTVHLPQVGLFSDLQYEPADVRRLALRSELPSVHRVAGDHSSVGAMTHDARGTSPGIHRHRRPPRFLREVTISGGKPVRIVVRWMRHCRSSLSNGWRTPTTGLRASLARQFNRTQNVQPFTARGACDGHRFARDHEPMGLWVANLKRSSVFGSPERIGGNGGFTRGQQDRQHITADPVGVGAPIPFGVLMEFGGFTQCHTNLRKGAGGRRCSVSQHSGTAPGDSGRWLDPGSTRMTAPAMTGRRVHRAAGVPDPAG